MIGKLKSSRNLNHDWLGLNHRENARQKREAQPTQAEAFEEWKVKVRGKHTTQSVSVSCLDLEILQASIRANKVY